MSMTDPQHQSGGNGIQHSIASSSQISDGVLPARPNPWQMSGGLLDKSDLLEKLTGPGDIPALGVSIVPKLHINDRSESTELLGLVCQVVDRLQAGKCTS